MTGISVPAVRVWTRRSTPSATAKRAARRRTGAYVGMLAIIGALNLFGLVMVLSASSVQAERMEDSPWYFFNRQVLWVGLGALAMVVASRIDYRRLRQFGAPLVGVASVLMIAVLVPGIGVTVGGSSRWLGFGPFRMQPSELAKLGLLIFAADLLARRADSIDDRRMTIRPVIGVYGVVAGLLLLQPDLGTALIAGGIVISVLFLSGVPLRSMGVLTLAAGAVTFVAAKAAPYRWRRMTSFLDPFADVANTGYQAAQGRVALAAGGVFGVGLGSSRAKWGFLPAAHTDFIFAIVGEELGLAGTLSVLALFAIFAALGTRAALRAPDRFGMLLAGGVTAWIIGQAALNIGAVVGLVPITGVPLPFVSSGGSSLIPMMAGVGMLLNVTRQSKSTLRSPAPRSPQSRSPQSRSRTAAP